MHVELDAREVRVMLGTLLVLTTTVLGTNGYELVRVEPAERPSTTVRACHSCPCSSHREHERVAELLAR